MAVTTTARSVTDLKMNRVMPHERRLRSPRHTFHITANAFVITPFLAAPVLPGETMKSLTLQSNVKTDRLANELIGWWKEYYFFYVALSQLANADEYQAMMLDPAYSLSASLAGANNDFFGHSKGNPTITGDAYARIVTDFFRDDGEDHTDHTTAAAFCLAKLKGHYTILESAMDKDAFDSAYDATVVNEAGSAVVTAEDIDTALQTYHFLRDQGLTEAATYEDYLRSFGVNVTRAQEPTRPELLRYISQFELPRAAVDGDGSIAARVLWQIQGRADKDRFFREPGLIMGVTVARPKVYIQNVEGAAINTLNDAFSWLPAVLKDRPDTSLRTFANSLTDGYLQNQTSDYVLDTRDLFIHGDQWVNLDKATATDAHLVPVPADGFAGKDYPTEAWLAELWSSTPDDIREDGAVGLNILGTQMDYS